LGDVILEQECDPFVGTEPRENKLALVILEQECYPFTGKEPRENKLE
jgi:hypothetical protein